MQLNDNAFSVNKMQIETKRIVWGFILTNTLSNKVIFVNFYIYHSRGDYLNYLEESLHIMYW
jgi:hypothetical protein